MSVKQQAKIGTTRGERKVRLAEIAAAMRALLEVEGAEDIVRAVCVVIVTKDKGDDAPHIHLGGTAYGIESYNAMCQGMEDVHKGLGHALEAGQKAQAASRIGGRRGKTVH